MYMGKVIVPSELCTGGGDLFMKEQHKLKKEAAKAAPHVDENEPCLLLRANS